MKSKRQTCIGKHKAFFFEEEYNFQKQTKSSSQKKNRLKSNNFMEGKKAIACCINMNNFKA